MQIKFLGTSSGWPLPRLGHHCEICDSSNPKDKRTRSQVLVNESILLDAGPETYQHLIKEPHPENISTVLITHAHPDHTFGLWDLDHVYEKKKIDLYSTEETLKKIQRQGIGFNSMNKRPIQEFEEIEAEGLKVSLFPVKHSKATPTVGVRLTEKKKTFVYIPDVAEILPESQKFIQNADILTLDGSSLDPAGPKGWGHLTILEGIELAKSLKAKEVYFTHIGHGKITRPHDILEQYVQEHGGPNFHIAYDNLKIELQG